MTTVDAQSLSLDDLLDREWLTVNQIGGFACATAAGANTRKYHGLLVASMAPPVRRMVLLSRVEETLIVNRTHIPLSCSEYPGTIHPDGHTRLRAFSAEPFPRWAFQAEGFTLEKSVRLVKGQNTVCITYTLLAGDAPVKLELRPLFALRGMHELCFQWNGRLEAQDRSRRHHRIGPTSRTPEVFFAHDGAFEHEGCWYMSTIYRREAERGYAGLEDLWMPGIVRWAIAPGQSVHFVCSAEPIDFDRTVAELDAQSAGIAAHELPGLAADSVLETLLRAAEQFVVHPADGSSGVVTQYPWSPPSGRDALIAFTGLMLVPRRFAEARSLLESMSRRMRDGIMPSEFPEDGSEPKYTGADTSLWFINAVHEYLRYTDDQQAAVDLLLETIVRIIRSYQAGTALGIGVDAEGLLVSHEPATGTTWMDAKVGDWVITPRQGRAVEINALWYNALRIAADLCERCGRTGWASEFNMLGDSVWLAFNKRFWNEMAGCCFDVVNDRGADPSIRPNQIFAVSLTFPVLAPERQPAVLDKVRAMLLTPVGLRTLAPNDPGYQRHYRGDVVSRDRACHQGSAYPWLLGPFVRAMIRVFGKSTFSRGQAMQVLDGCLQHIQNDGLGQLCELFDGDAPHHPGGAIASARSVGQILQVYSEDILDRGPRAAARASAAGTRPAVGA